MTKAGDRNPVQKCLETAIGGFFYQLGKTVGRCPWPFLILPLIITVICGLGFTNFKQMNDIQEGFTPLNAESRLERIEFKEFWMTKPKPQKRRVARAAKIVKLTRRKHVPICIKSRFGGNLIDEGDKILDLLDYFESNFSITYRGKKKSWTNFCHPFCKINDPLRLFLRSSSQASMNDNPNIKLTHPAMEILSTKIFVGNTFFSVTKNETNAYVTNAEMVHISLFYLDKPHLRHMLQMWQGAIVQRILSYNHPDFELYTATHDAYNLAIAETGMATVPYLGGSFVLILIFTLVTTMRSDCLRSKPWEAVAGILTPILALVASFGFLLYTGLEYQPIVTVSLFLILAIGCDDMYLLLHGWHNSDSSLSTTERMAETMKHVGPSITITSLTDGLSFAIGILTPIPAIRTFCTYTATSIFVSYLFQITFFAAVMVLGGRREEAGHHACVCCLRMEKNPQFGCLIKLGEKYQKFLKAATPLVITNGMRIVVGILMLVYLGLSIYGMSSTKLDLSLHKLFLPGSHMATFDKDIKEKYFMAEATEVSVILHNPGNLENYTNRLLEMELVNEYEQIPYYLEGSTKFWLRPYMDYLNLFSADNTYFTYKNMKSFLHTSNYEKWRESLNFNEDLCEKENCIHKYKFSCYYTDLKDWNNRIEGLELSRSIAAKEKYSSLNLSVFYPHSLGCDNVSSIPRTTFNIILFTMICMTVVCALFVPNLTSIVCAIITVVSINIGVFGFLVLWGVDLDPMSMAGLLMAIGFSVDFTAHMTYHYYNSEANGPAGRLLAAYQSILWPTIQAGLSTMICASLMAVPGAYMIQTFVKTVVLVVVFGLIHGMIVLPVILTSIEALCQPKREEPQNGVQTVAGNENGVVFSLAES